MKICIMTAETNSGNGHPEFLGVVVGKTEEEATRRARKKWSWFGSEDPVTLYYAGYPRTTTEWHEI